MGRRNRSRNNSATNQTSTTDENIMTDETQAPEDQATKDAAATDTQTADTAAKDTAPAAEQTATGDASATATEQPTSSPETPAPETPPTAETAPVVEEPAKTEEQPVVEAPPAETTTAPTPPVAEQAPVVEQPVVTEQLAPVVQEQAPAPAPVPPAAPTAPAAPTVVETGAVDVVTLPIPKAKAATTTTVTAGEVVDKPKQGLDSLTLADIVKHKHGFELSSATGNLADILAFLDRYETSMSGGDDIQADKGESLQKQLYKTYLRIFVLENTRERDVAMEVLLWKFYKDEKGSMRVTQLSRFTRGGKWMIQELNMFAQLNHVFGMIKNPVDRIDRLKQIKLPAIIAAFPGDKVRYTDGFISWASAIH